MQARYRFAVWMLTLACGVAQGQDNKALFDKGRQLFLQGATPSCTLCHTLKEAGSTGAVGPVLDELKPDASKVATALRNGVGAMPSFRNTLSEEQIAALAWYVAKASAGQ
jgi:cytochrome c6